MMSQSNSLRRLLGAGLLFAAIATTQADTLVTFQVDMNAEGTAIAGGSTVYVRGNFNGQDFSLLPAHALTNDGSGIFSGTINITNAPSTIVPCKFYYNNPGDTWEGDPNRQFLLAAGSQVLPLTAWNVKDWPAPTNNVTFQIDMTHQVTQLAFDPNTGYVRVSGAFNGWNESIDFTNNPAASGAATNIYSQTVEVVGFAGSQPGGYKFRAPIGDTYETIPNRPSFTLTGGDQTLPLVYWNDISPFTPTNDVTFRVDMSAQILAGTWTPDQYIRVSGAMTGWGDGVDLTNNPALSGSASNVYSQILPVVANVGANIQYKFRSPIGDTWESPVSTAGANRSFQVAGGAQVLPLVFYNDASVCDLLTQPVTVTFVLHLTNGTTATDGTVYDGSQSVHINGDFNNWNGGTWDITLPQMINNPIGSDFYEHTAVVPAGRALGQKFKFSIGGADNEAGFQADHIQYVRSTGPTFTMPVSEFGTNFAAVRVEQAFGNLAAGAPVGGNIPVTWLGLPCVTLQTRASLTSGSWIDLPATDATSSTNWPNAGSQFFRLQKRNSP